MHKYWKDAQETKNIVTWEVGMELDGDRDRSCLFSVTIIILDFETSKNITNQRLLKT